MNRLVKTLQKNWQGPSLAVDMAGQEVVLGQGNPRTKVAIKNSQTIWKLLRSPVMTFGEGYMSGEITVDGELEDVLIGSYKSTVLWEDSWLTRLKKFFTDKISITQAVSNAQHHYDVGNDFYKMWLDKNMVYSCAVFLNENDSLEKAQEQKLDLLCRKAQLKAGHTLLDIGCGWGGLIMWAAEKYGVKATGITPAKEQAAYIREEVKKRGLQDKVTVIEGDWRTLTGQFDHIISVGMFEHVGQKQYREFFEKWNSLLAPHGISLLHTIGRMKSEATDPWIRKYIFPGGFLPTVGEVTNAIGNQKMVVSDVENLWQHYAKTLDHWGKNFLAVRDKVVGMYGEEFARMWWLYLEGSRIGFLYDSMQLWQIVILKDKSAQWPLNRGSIYQKELTK